MARSFPSASHRAPSAHTPAALAPSVRDWLQRSSRHQPLAERTVLELSRCIVQWQQHPGGPDHEPRALQRRALRARNQLVRHNLRLIGHTWNRHRSSLAGEDEGTADAFQEAAISLVRAAEKYDPSRGYCFSTYASFWVRRGFSEHERRGRRMIRLPHDKAAIVLRAQRLALEHQTLQGRLPSLAWLAERCGPRESAVPLHVLEELLLIWWRTAIAELDRPGRGEEGGEGLPLVERIVAAASSEPQAIDDPLPAAALYEQEGAATAAGQPWEQAFSRGCPEERDPHRALLPSLLQRLSPRQRQLLWHRYLREHPLTPRQIQRVMGLAIGEQAQMEQEALAVLRQAARELDGSGA